MCVCAYVCLCGLPPDLSLTLVVLTHPPISLWSHTTQGARNLQPKQMRTSLREPQSWGPDRRKDSLIPWLIDFWQLIGWVVQNVQIHVRDLANIWAPKIYTQSTALVPLVGWRQILGCLTSATTTAILYEIKCVLGRQAKMQQWRPEDVPIQFSGMGKALLYVHSPKKLHARIQWLFMLVFVRQGTICLQNWCLCQRFLQSLLKKSLYMALGMMYLQSFAIVSARSGWPCCINSQERVEPQNWQKAISMKSAGLDQGCKTEWSGVLGLENIRQDYWMSKQWV